MTRFRFPPAAPLAALLVALALACGGGGGQAERGTGQGQVVAVDAAKGEITLDHGEIPGLMGPMTMSFPVADPGLLEGVAAGEGVEFDVEHAGGTYTVTGIRKR